tara:strand:+ start:3374 stop:3865 length:492 start_codon:yes stop_codon:yes gene_type:complete
MKKKCKNFAGFSMVEVVVVLVLLSLASTMFLFALSTGKDIRTTSEIRTIQGTLLNNLQNQIRAREFEDPTTGSTNFGKELDQGENSINQFDDIDDFHQYSITSIPGFESFGYSVDVKYVPLEENGFNLNPNPENQTNYKSITVTVTHKTLSSMTDIMIIGSEF